MIEQQPLSYSSATSVRGFTIVELLIVIVVIGILAAIIIVAFNGIQNRANETTVRNDLASMAKKMEMFRVDSVSASYPSASELTNADLRVTKSAYKIRNNLYYCRSDDGQRYSFGAVAKGNREFFLTDNTVNVVANGSVTAANTCPQIGRTGNSQAVGYDESSGTLWQAWVK